MAKEICVFCGNEVGTMLSDFISCGPASQFACRSCVKELKSLSEEERCRRALRLGLAKNPQYLQDYLDIVEHAEEARFTCLRCGEKLTFGQAQSLDSSPYLDGLLGSSFDVLPVYCKKCGKIEFYDPTVISENKLLSYLWKKDLAEQSGT